jgi:hypothetical protein
MIQSAMMFALGAFLSGLAWLALSILLVRRARRMTERQIRASIAISRAEFETERDEMRARHAVEMYQQERAVSRGLDAATAYRLESDIKERDLVSALAELRAREEDMQELQQRLTEERNLVQDLERRHAEAGTMLRAVQHALTQEVNRRTLAQEALDEAATMADRRRLELSAVRAQNEALRAMIGDRMPLDENGAPLLTLIPDMGPAEPGGTARAGEADVAVGDPATGGSVVPMPTRQRQPAADESEAMVAEAARDLQRLAGEAKKRRTPQSDGRAPASTEPVLPAAERAGDPESRLSDALAEIRALKRANQAGE